jgi:hypothetical protein
MIRIAAIATVLALALAASAQAATLKADYRFEHSLASSVAGAADLTNAGASTCDANGPNSFTKLQVSTRKIPVLHFQRDGGVVGPAYPLIAKGNYSAVIDFQFSSTYDGFWRRILDLSNGGSDDGFYVAPEDLLNFYNDGDFGTTTFTDNVWHQVALTRVGTTKLVSEYLDGNLETSFTDSVPIALVPTTDTIFFQDNPATGGPSCESSDGYVSRIRLYTGALTSTAIAKLAMLPPAQAITPGQTSGINSETITVTGKNFGPSETVNVTFKDAAATQTAVGSTTTDATGAFSTTFQVPVSAALGAGSIIATGATSTLRASKPFTVTT